QLAAEEALSKGLTTVHDAGSPPQTIEMMKKVVDERKLPIRVWMMLRETPDRLAVDMPKYRIVDYGDHRFTVRGIKRAVGGALRWRIEHAQHINGRDIPRFGQLGVIASMQGIHSTSDAPYVLARLGPRRAEEGAYVWQSLMKTGAIIANGTDAPVEDIDPIPSFYASVSRKLKDGKVFFPAQRMTRMEALRSYTINAAYADFDEAIKGSLRVGKLADITVVSKDLMTVPEDQIQSAEVLYTIVGGKVQFSRISS